MTRRILAFLCAFVMLLSFSCVQAEDAESIQSSTSESFSQFYRIPEQIYYRGDMVIHGYLKGADTSSVPLDFAYVLTSMPYIILNKPTSWDVTITGGQAPYSCTVVLAHQADLSMDQFNSPWDVVYWFDLEDDTFDYTFTEAGRYFWEFRVMDENGEFFSFQTRIYEAYTEEDESDETTVVGKVNAIIDEYITEDMSDYTRALVLHDWLIYNATYDYDDPRIYDAYGVLLEGTGVCDSYARAYLMLCTAAGLECMYISGTAGDDPDPNNWGNHGWNMVKLNGSWYHVDCTWDDPNEGGYECHDYFCVDDETMARDHRWNKPDDVFDSEGYLPPDAEGGEFEDDGTSADTANYHFTFSTVDEFSAGIDQLVAAGIFYNTIYAKYTGTENLASFYYDTYQPWTGEKMNELFAAGYIKPGEYYSTGIENGLFYFELPWKTPTSNVRLSESTLRLSIGEESILVPVCTPEDAALTWTSSDPSIATVTGSVDPTLGAMAVITGVSAGEVTITVSIASGNSDSVTVTVLPAHSPDFGFNTATDSEGVTLSWEDIPGVTEYRIYRRYNGIDTLLDTTASTRVYMGKDQLPSDVQQELYIVGVRLVGNKEVFTYTSEPITYGKLTLRYNATLPRSLTVIEDEAFEGNTSLTSLKIPGTVKRIGEDAFEGCTNLTTIRIPASVTYIGEDAFEDCPLQYAEVSPGSYAEEWLLEHFPNITLVH